MKAKKAVQHDVPNACWWVAAGPVGTKLEMLFLECERWVDARRVARTVFGPEADVASVAPETMKRTPPHRVQVRWAGSAAGRVSDLRLQTREIRRGKPGAWVDV